MRIAVPLLLATACAGWWVLAWRREGSWRIGPLLLLVPVLLFTANEIRWARTEAGLTTAAAPVLERPGTVREVEDGGSAFGCERLMRNFFSSQGRVGHVWFSADGTPAPSAFLSMGTCSNLKSFRADPDSASLDEIVAVHTLTHEAAHLSGIREEHAAECLALEYDAEVMTRLGASPEQADHYARHYRAEVYPRLPEQYRSACPPVG